MSQSVSLTSGIPQGSVLGPILFTLYTVPLGDICRSHGIEFQLYADNQQNYLTFKPIKGNTQPQDECISALENCIAEVCAWMGFNKLKLNDSKTKFIIFSTRQQLAKITNINIRIGQVSVIPSDCVCNLGYFMDKLLKNAGHINTISGPLYGTLWDIRSIRGHLDTESCKTIIQGLVLSKLDYRNSLLAGSAKYQLDKLQHIQNMSSADSGNMITLQTVWNLYTG